MLSNTLQEVDPDGDDLAVKVEVYDAISTAVANKDEMTKEETDQIGEVMMRVSEDISTNENLSKNTEL